MVDSESSAAGLAPEQEEKVARIFSRFDEDKDGILRKVEVLPNIPLALHGLTSLGPRACVRL